MRIIVEGNPVAKKRPRFARRGKFVSTYSDQETEEGRFLLLAKGQIDRPMVGPLRVDCLFFMPRPASHYGTGRNAGHLKPSAPRYHTGRPDTDNMLKFCMDALNGYAWRDDAQIVKVSGAKTYADDGDPRTEIFIQEEPGDF